jgi:hypothetical protein
VVVLVGVTVLVGVGVGVGHGWTNVQPEQPGFDSLTE